MVSEQFPENRIRVSFVSLWGKKVIETDVWPGDACLCEWGNIGGCFKICSFSKWVAGYNVAPAWIDSGCFVGDALKFVRWIVLCPEVTPRWSCCDGVEFRGLRFIQAVGDVGVLLSQIMVWQRLFWLTIMLSQYLTKCTKRTDDTYNRTLRFIVLNPTFRLNEPSDYCRSTPEQLRHLCPNPHLTSHLLSLDVSLRTSQSIIGRTQLLVMMCPHHFLAIVAHRYYKLFRRIELVTVPTVSPQSLPWSWYLWVLLLSTSAKLRDYLYNFWKCRKKQNNLFNIHTF